MRVRKLEGGVFQSSGEKMGQGSCRVYGVWENQFIMNTIDEGEEQDKVWFALLWAPGVLGPIALFFYLI